MSLTGELRHWNVVNRFKVAIKLILTVINRGLALRLKRRKNDFNFCLLNLALKRNRRVFLYLKIRFVR